MSSRNMFSLYFAAWPDVFHRFMLYMFGVITYMKETFVSMRVG